MQVRLRKQYTIRSSGNRFRQYTAEIDGRTFTVDVKVREGWHGPVLWTNAEAKAQATTEIQRRARGTV